MGNPYECQRKRLVETEVRGEGITDERVLNAMLRIPRHRFVPEELRGKAYEDRPLKIGHGQVITQPSLVARMTEAARVEPTDRVLEIGTGSGYQAAILAELAETVLTVERFKDMAGAARGRLRSLGYENVRVVEGDGSRGWPQNAPYDVIMVTAAAPQVPPPLKQQLKDGGRLVIPLGDRHSQGVYCLTRSESGDGQRTRLIGARFVPLVGEHGWES